MNFIIVKNALSCDSSLSRCLVRKQKVYITILSKPNLFPTEGNHIHEEPYIHLQTCINKDILALMKELIIVKQSVYVKMK